MPEDAHRRWGEVEQVGSEELEPSLGEQGRHLVGRRRRSGYERKPAGPVR